MLIWVLQIAITGNIEYDNENAGENNSEQWDLGGQ